MGKYDTQVSIDTYKHMVYIRKHLVNLICMLMYIENLVINKTCRLRGRE